MGWQTHSSRRIGAPGSALRFDIRQSNGSRDFPSPFLETNTRAWTSTLALAEKTELSVYDASYLELAIRLNVLLASADGKLCHAANRAGVPLIATA
jgi:hypothetical protein